MDHAIRTFLLGTAFWAMGPHAEEPSYTAVSLGAVVEDWDDFDDNSRGMGLEASVETGDIFYAWARVSRVALDLDVPAAFSDIQTYARSVGVGIHRELADKLSVFGEVGVIRDKVEYKLLPIDFDQSRWVDEENAIRETDSLNGWIASGGLRAMLTERTELFGSLTHREADDEGVSTLSAGVEFRVYHDVGLRASVSTREDASGYGVGVVWRY